jgi:hypothetical protein
MGGADGQNRTVDTSLFTASGKRAETTSYRKKTMQKVTFCVMQNQ